MRLVAVDETKLDVPDTPANERALGRPGVVRGQSPWPQVLVVALAECATHALLDVGVWRVDANEHAAAQRLTRSLTAVMLLLYNAGLHSVDLVTCIQQHGAHLLGRLPSHVKPVVRCPLPDGTQLVTLRPSQRSGMHRSQPLCLIRYTLADPRRPGHQREHRLLTSLLDPRQHPTLDVVVLYHQCWEFELLLDEVVTHQCPRQPLRSQKPVGVIQELYALLLAHYLIRAVMVEAAATIVLPPTRLRSLATLRLMCPTLADWQRCAPVHHASSDQTLLADSGAATLPARANRGNPRVVTPQQSKLRVKRPHRHPPSLTPFRDPVVLLI